MKHHFAESEGGSTRILVIIFLSLLLHCFFLFLLSLNNDGQFRLLPFQPLTDSSKQLEQQPHQTMSQQQWATRHAGMSNFGAPVVFQEDQEEATSQQSDALIDKHEDSRKETDTTAEEVNTILDPAAQEVQQTQQEQAQTQENLIEEPMTTLVNEIPAALHLPATKQPSLAKKIVPSLSKSQHLMNKTLPKKTSGSIPKSMSLTKLAQGFLEYTKGMGDSLIEVKGNHDGPPSDEQLKHERYWQKIGWCIQKTSKMNSFLQRDLPNVYMQTAWHMVLKRDGALNHLALMQSSGNSAVDHALEAIIKESSASFPPVPSYFPGEFYIMRFTLFYEPYVQAPKSIKYTQR